MDKLIIPPIYEKPNVGSRTGLYYYIIKIKTIIDIDMKLRIMLSDYFNIRSTDDMINITNNNLILEIHENESN